MFQRGDIIKDNRFPFYFYFYRYIKDSDGFYAYYLSSRIRGKEKLRLYGESNYTLVTSIFREEE